MQYVGIADAHGLDSFVPWTNLYALSSLTRDKHDVNTINSLHIRALANRHRHAVIYRVTLSQEEGEKIKKLYDTGKYEEALIQMKKAATEVEIGKDIGMKKSWNLIPNNDLDPFS